MKEYILYGHNECLFSRRAKLVLDEHNQVYHYVDIKKECVSNVELAGIIGHDIYTLPQVFLGNKYISGFHDLQRHFSII